jgi:NodT family efflux transporter outer membrane factor (OMF) lipoprotein
MRSTFIFSLIALIALAGCQTGPDYTRPETALPEDWSSPLEGGVVPGAPEVTTWWTELNDATLNDLIARAITQNYDLRIAEARVREARAARGIAAADLYPQVGATASATRSQSVEQNIDTGSPVSGGVSLGPGGLSRTVTVRGENVTLSRTASGAGNTTGVTISPGSNSLVPDRTTDLFKLGFDATWELDVFGGNRRAVEAADADLEAIIERRRDVLVSLAAEVALNYIDLRAAQQRLSITQRNIDAQTETVKLTGARFDAGLSSELDAVRAEALLARFESQVPLLEERVAAAIHRLGVLLGGAPGMLKAELKPEASLPETPETVPVGLPSELLRRRPDIRSAERELAAQTARIGVAVADLYPKFSLTGSFSGQSNVFGEILNNAGQMWSFGPSVQWPIFQGGRIRANIEVQNARQEQALLAFEQTVNRALEDVENALVGYAKEQVYRESLKKAVAANERAVKLANERYVRGLEGFLNVLQAQQELFETEDMLVQSDSMVLVNLVSLYKALGGGWDPEAAEASSPASDRR